VDILPRHFYSQIPDLRALEASSDWRQPRSLVGVHGTGVDEQVNFLREICPPAVSARLATAEVYESACRENDWQGFGEVEADVLYAFTMAKRPSRVVQVGAGVSTSVILRAAGDGGFRVDVACVDPFPTSFLTEKAARGEVELHACAAQHAPLELLTGLQAGDLLFVDSTHAVRPGGEVNRIVLEVLPRLGPGVWVHFHDVHFPYDYSPEILSDDLFFWNEQTLLLAFLTMNDAYTIRAALSMVHHAAPDVLKELIPRYRPMRQDYGVAVSAGHDGHLPSSAYLQVREG
jgi:hypothetical protein